MVVVGIAQHAVQIKMIPHIPISAFLHGEHFPSQRESVVALYVDGSIRPGDIQVGAQLVPEAETPAFPSQQQVQRSISVCPLSPPERRGPSSHPNGAPDHSPPAERPAASGLRPLRWSALRPPRGGRTGRSTVLPGDRPRASRRFLPAAAHQQTVTQKEFIFAVPYQRIFRPLIDQRPHHRLEASAQSSATLYR